MEVRMQAFVNVAQLMENVSTFVNAEITSFVVAIRMETEYRQSNLSTSSNVRA